MHIPVLQDEVIKYLDPKANENFVDCTIGNGGHSTAILERTAPKGRLLGIDLDKEQIKNLESKTEHYGKRVVLANDNYANLEKIVNEKRFKNISGILIDLGFSSRHVDESGRGFTFSKNEPLDMRYDQKNPLTAEKILNYWSQTEIEKILREFGQEQFAKQIAEGIIQARRIVAIKNTFQLKGIIERSVPGWYRHGKVNFSTKTFQAIRVAVNGELENLKLVLPQSIKVLKKGGKIVVISFHSLEDGVVKDFLKNQDKIGRISILTKKPVQPGRQEIIINPRSRSAKLRAAKKNE